MINSYIDPTAILNSLFKIGNNVEICEGVVFSDKPFIIRHDGIKSIKRIEPRFGIDIKDNVFIGPATIVFSGYDHDTIIKNNVAIGPKVIVGHDVIINDFVRVMGKVFLGGYVEIGKWSILGMGSNIRNRIKIGENTFIGMGSNVVSDIPDNVIAFGNPCKVIEKHDGNIKNFIKRFLL